MGVEWLKKALVLVTLVTHITSQEVPGPPRLVRVSCNSRQATLQWQPAENDNSPITAYSIQYNNSFTPDPWQNVLPEVAATETQHTVSLSPWMNYTFRVVARNSAGVSEPSGISSVCSTPPDAPRKNPDNVTGAGIEPDNIVITWDHMHEAEHNGPGFVYRVYWKRDDPEEQWNSADIYDWRLNQMVIPDQPSFARYRIKVAALNHLGEAPLPQEVIGYSGEGVPTQAPRNLKILHLNSNAVVLNWDPVEERTLRGYHNGYLIQVWPEDGDELAVKEIKTSPNTTRAFVDIPPNTKMHAQVFARNGRRTGPPSNLLTFHSPEGVPGPVQSFEAHQLGSSSLYLIWRRPYISNGVLTGYKIYYHVVDGIKVGKREDRLPAIPIQQSRAKLSGLKPDTKYRLHIVATTRVGEGEGYFIEFRTGPDLAVKPDTPFFYWFQEGLVNGSASVRVVWLPDVDGKPGSYFFVKQRLKGQTEFSVTEPEHHEDFMVVKNLDPCRTYEFQLVAVDGDFMTESAIKDVTMDFEVNCDAAENEILD